jgi:hypothetical protein
MSQKDGLGLTKPLRLLQHWLFELVHLAVNSHERGGNHQLSSLAIGRTWCAGTPMVGKRPLLRGKRRSQTQSLAQLEKDPYRVLLRN